MNSELHQADLAEVDFQRRMEWREYATNNLLAPFLPGSTVGEEIRVLSAQVVHLVDQVERLKSAVLDCEEAARSALPERFLTAWKDWVDDLSEDRDPGDAWHPRPDPTALRMV